MTTTHLQSWRTRVALLLAGQTLSLIGSSVVQYAIVWHLAMRTDSGAVMTVTTLCAALPQAIVSLFGGVWADRWNRKALIMLPDALIALATVALALSIANGGEALALFFVILMIRSAGGGVQTPAVQSLIPDITPEEKLLRVNSINGTIQSVNMIAAPAIAAVLINIMPLWAILYVDVTTAVIGIAFVALIRVQSAARTRSNEAPSVRTEMRAGLRYAWRYPRIRSVLISYALVCFVNIAPMNLTLLLMNRGFQGANPRPKIHRARNRLRQARRERDGVERGHGGRRRAAGDGRRETIP
ncbi:MFS transporter [Bifidobacterium pseudolongum]|uniref:MFS transporter n=1 Tax=Bifidobacterium pseudolongum TaxID=1694 RepID=UPI0009B8FC46|nr:MFS transporter [Bifidobacterium pseudolongum]UNP91449.1 MFS transporter [Bifidobacterium pseudolongum subsp. pseudolongum]WCA40830.1 MFS transporter [Bifidobacterium pseudolongum subsp. pseudolongum]